MQCKVRACVHFGVSNVLAFIILMLLVRIHRCNWMRLRVRYRSCAKLANAQVNGLNSLVTVCVCMCAPGANAKRTHKKVICMQNAEDSACSGC